MRKRRNSILAGIDWPLVILYLVLVILGWINIYSASITEQHHEILDFSTKYGKQLLWIGLSIFLIIFILFIDAKFYERFSSLIYITSLISLLGLFIFGKTISGATSWYVINGISIQPSEFAKAATALALAKLLSEKHYNLKIFKNQLKAFVIILLPALLIIPQPDPGSAVIYLAFFLTLYKQGLPLYYLLIGISAVILFILALIINQYFILIGLVIFMLLIYILTRKKKISIFYYIIPLTIAIGYVFTVGYIFNTVFEQRHRDRFNIILGLAKDTKGIGYNTNQAEIAIGSGGFFGKGFLQGTQTKGDFVPEQHTDYIFSTIGEEWGFLGSSLVILLFMMFLFRILQVTKRQKNKFSAIYGYSVAAIFFVHFTINIGMVIGLLPTVGIPLPFFSYGGSALWGFTLLLFIFIRLDANRIYEW